MPQARKGVGQGRHILSPPQQSDAEREQSSGFVRVSGPSVDRWVPRLRYGVALPGRRYSHFIESGAPKGSFVAFPGV